MNLPTPNADDIRKFQSLHERLYGKALSEKEALGMYTGLVQLYYLIGGHETAHAERVRRRKPKNQLPKSAQ